MYKMLNVYKKLVLVKISVIFVRKCLSEYRRRCPDTGDNMYFAIIAITSYNILHVTWFRCSYTMLCCIVFSCMVRFFPYAASKWNIQLNVRCPDTGEPTLSFVKHYLKKVNALALNKQPNKKNIKPDLRKSPKIFKWDKNSNQFFKETLKKDSISNRLNDICQQEISNPNAIALEISKLLIDTAKTAKIKFKKQISQPTNKISFDKECETGKLHLESLGKQTKKEIDNPNLRKEIRNQKRHFRNLIKQVRNFKGPPAFCQKQQTRSFPKNKPMSFLSLH